MTPQELFNRALRLTLAQGKPALKPHAADMSPTCTYYSPEGLMCSIGLLAGPERAKALDEDGIDGIEDYYDADAEDWFLSEHFPPDVHEHPWLCLDIQRAHDNAAVGAENDIDFTRRFKEQMEAVAETYCLEYPA